MWAFLLFVRVQPTTSSKQVDKSFLANSSTLISGQSAAKCHFFVLASLHATNADVSLVVTSLHLKSYGQVSDAEKRRPEISLLSQVILSTKKKNR